MKRLLALAFVVPLAACSGPPVAASSSTSAASASSTPKPAATVSSSTPTPTSTPKPTAPTTDLAVGQTASLSQVEFTLLQLKSFPKTGSWGPWQLFLVKACVKATEAQGLPVSYLRWRAEDANGSRYNMSGIVGDPRFEPGYPGGNDPQDVIQPGKCLQGWMPAETSVKLTSLTYANDKGERASWKLP